MDSCVDGSEVFGIVGRGRGTSKGGAIPAGTPSARRMEVVLNDRGMISSE